MYMRLSIRGRTSFALHGCCELGAPGFHGIHNGVSAFGEHPSGRILQLLKFLCTYIRLSFDTSNFLEHPSGHILQLLNILCTHGTPVHP